MPSAKVPRPPRYAETNIWGAPASQGGQVESESWLNTICIAQYNFRIMKKRPTEEAYAELQFAYDFYNRELFDNSLPACMITFQREKRTMGYFSLKRFVRTDGSRCDEIALNPEYFALYPMIEVLQTLTHEMVHQWQCYFGKPSRACYHNWEFASKMESLGLMPSSTGRPGGKKTGQKISDYVIRGGLFEQVTARLLADGFAISWMDRFPAVPPAALLTPPPPVIQAPGVLTQDFEDGEPEDADTAETATPALEASAWLPPASLGVPLELDERLPDEDRSNRVKYSCPKCAINVWGKPRLRIKCEDCQRSLEPVERILPPV